MERNKLQQLLARAIDGDRRAEETLMGRLHVRFSEITRWRVRNDDVEDIVHDACVTVLEKYRSLAPHVEFEAWAYQVLRNKIGTHLRDSSVRQRRVEAVAYIDDVRSTAASPIDPDLRRSLVHCLRAMTKVYPRYARALNLSNQGYDTQEICDRLGIKANNLYVMLHRCREWLNDCMSKGAVTR